MQALAKEALATKGVALVLASGGGNFLSKVNQGYMYVRTVPHEERTVSRQRHLEGPDPRRPLEAFQGNYAQRDVMIALRQRFRKFTDMRTQVRNIAGFNIGGGTFDIDLALRGPELEKLSEYGDILKAKARRSAASWTSTRRCGSTSPSSRGDRSPAGGRPPRGHPQIADRAAPDGGRRRSGLALPRSVVNDDYDVQIPTHGTPTGATSTRSRGCTCRADIDLERRRDPAPPPGRDGRPAGGLVRARQPRAHRAEPTESPHRPHGSAARDRVRAQIRARLWPGRPARAAAAGRDTR
jgi:hypothetical protein